ncbi:PAS domain-containing protein [Sphingomonas sp. JC676]|uniref:sensor histidine kinase n=1 Tax=Sphingomonas sp. JC676 TaxID=2768065 RepID=UPI0016582F6C|nr:ATP-binding protein [Sphingomonas sp. JC676]MBC9032719.1 PAS domain-containing protein [Sphingomonas sp. JC676]
MTIHSAPPFAGDAPFVSRAPGIDRASGDQRIAEREVDRFRRALGPFVVATEATRMAMVFTNALEGGNPIIFANDSFLKLTGYSFAEAVGQSFGFLMSHVADPESLERIASQFEAEAVETIEVKCHRRDERILLLAIRINPVHDRSGKVVQHCISFVDLSVHEKRMREERSALHSLYQHTPDFIVTMEGPDHLFTFANDSFHRLVGHRHLLGIGVAEAVPEFPEQGFLVLLDEVYRTGQSFTGSNMPVCLRPGSQGQDGVRFLDFIFQAVRDGSGIITGVFCEGHDATEQIQAADQVRLLQAELTEISLAGAMSTMAATIAHELNQPLTIISNYADVCGNLAKALPGADPALPSAIKGIVDGVKRAGEILRRLRDMTERRQSHYEMFDVKSAIRESLQLVRAGVYSGAPIEYRGSSKLKLGGDRVQIEQVIVNLARNACEAVAGREGGRVIVSATVRGQDVVVSVFDNGPGIPLDKVEALFEWTPSSKHGGMGIGLSICRHIIESHDGGRIWLESTSEAGACLAFSLPLPKPLLGR